MTQPTTPRRLTVVACGAGPAADVDTLIRLAQHRDWQVDLVATPSALPFLDVPALEGLTDAPVRSQYRQPDQSPGRTLSTSIAYIVAPATYNTICKLAAGISDTYALGVLSEAIGIGTPVVVLPFVNTALAARVPFKNAVAALQAEGVDILLGTPGWTPHPPGTGSDLLGSFPWASALDAAERATGTPTA
jgi:hypothetical protein